MIEARTSPTGPSGPTFSTPIEIIISRLGVATQIHLKVAIVHDRCYREENGTNKTRRSKIFILRDGLRLVSTLKIVGNKNLLG